MNYDRFLLRNLANVICDINLIFPDKSGKCVFSMYEQKGKIMEISRFLKRYEKKDMLL